jgi:hypothetical protein
MAVLIALKWCASLRANITILATSLQVPANVRLATMALTVASLISFALTTVQIKPAVIATTRPASAHAVQVSRVMIARNIFARVILNAMLRMDIVRTPRMNAYA